MMSGSKSNEGITALLTMNHLTVSCWDTNDSSTMAFVNPQRRFALSGGNDTYLILWDLGKPHEGGEEVTYFNLFNHSALG